MDATPFTPILEDLLRRVPGAFAAALVDAEGETVDYAGIVDPFDVKVAAAHSRIVLQDVLRYGLLGTPRWIIVRGVKRTLVTRALPEDYALVVLLRRRAGFAPSERAFAACERALAEEAGWRREIDRPAWYPVEVEIDRRGRPRRVGALDVEVLGAVVGARAFRVRTSAGNEVTLVREARSCWYADELDAGRSSPKNSGKPGARSSG
jgi:hypothetical protein